MDALAFALLLLDALGAEPRELVRPPQPSQAVSAAVGNDCTLKGKKLHGRVKVVEAFADFHVRVVDAFPDLKVKVVDSFADQCGKWQLVDAFPDFTIKLVDAFPELTIKYVDAFPGLP